MTNFETLLARHTGQVEQSTFATWQHANHLFDERRYTDAVRVLEALLRDANNGPTHDDGYAPASATGQAAARALLARAYYHSAQLGRAIEAAQSIIETDPGDAYAHLLLSRALERSGRSDEAGRHRSLAEAMGA